MEDKPIVMLEPELPTPELPELPTPELLNVTNIRQPVRIVDTCVSIVDGGTL